MSLKKRLYNWAHSNLLIKGFYEKLKLSLHDMREVNTHITEITPFIPRSGDYTGKRINLIIPSIKQEHLFGGITTAFDIFEAITGQGHYDRRIIVTDAPAEQADLKGSLSKYTLVEAGSDSSANNQLVSFFDRFAQSIPVSPHDYFLATAWWTAYFAQRVARWQAETYRQVLKKIIYLVQDYEPGFYPWSSQYVLAEGTYRYDGPQIAIFNSLQLKEYFNKHGYRFEHEYCFRPVLNKSLKECLEKKAKLPKKRQILIYGRPSIPRNGFTLIMEALRLWVWRQPGVQQWQVISAGEAHQDIDLGNGVTVTAKGKMDLEQYAMALAESTVGISLMFSPHPSYPPLEMASYGLQVITNSFANKELNNPAGTITSLQDLTPEALSEQLVLACAKAEKIIGSKAGKGKGESDTERLGYLVPLYQADDSDQFSFIEDLLRQLD